jgi:hypothetical protein
MALTAWIAAASATTVTMAIKLKQAKQANGTANG